MAILGKLTTTGVNKSRQARDGGTGFYIIPTRFGVSRDASSFVPSLNSVNSGTWYTEIISSRVNVDYNTIKFVCTIPQGASAVSDIIKEVYIFAEDIDGNEFILAFGQPSEEILYDPEGTVTLELQIALVEIDVNGVYVFKNTKATELEEHLTAPDAHSEITDALAKAGIFIPTARHPFDRVGQAFDEVVEFAGTKASAVKNTVTISARFNGDELNSETITFNGVKTLDVIVTEFNNAHPTNPITHDGLGSEVFPSSSITLSGGSYAVEEKDVVYKRADNVYDLAIADGTEKSKVSGMAFLGERVVRGLGGFVTYDTPYPIHTDLYLSDIEAGKITNISTSVKVGHKAGNDFILLASYGAGGGGASDSYDAIVSDSKGFKRYSTIQEAIDAIPSHGFILVEKREELKSRIRTNGKTVNIVFKGANTGLTRFLGQQDIQKITFDNVPDYGTWRIEYTDLFSGTVQKTNDLPFNASAGLIQSELNMLYGHSGVVVTGDYSNGFTLTFEDYIALPLVAFTDAGQNEIQRINFADIPDDGTIDFEFENNSGDNHAFNDTPEQLKSLLLSIPNINDIEVRGSLSDRYYEIEFIGVDGKQNKSLLSVSNSNLNVGGSGGNGGVIVAINGVSVFPTNFEVIVEGRYPASNLKYGSAIVGISVTKIQNGIEAGASKAFELDADECQIIGMGKISNFNTGIDMSSVLKTRIEVQFDNVELPIDGKDQIIGRDFNFDGSIGIERDAFDAKPLYDEFINPVIDGINSSFTLKNGKPNTTAEFMLFLDQLALRPTMYSINNDIVTIEDGDRVPVQGQDIYAYYKPDILKFTPDIVYNPFFRENIVIAEDNFKVILGSSYNRGSDRLEVYRNGILMTLGTLIDEPVMRYQEFSDSSIGLSLHCKPSEIFSFFFKDIRVLSKSIITGQAQYVFKVPKYTVGQNTLRVFRNGVLMNNVAIGDIASQYAEVDETHIMLSVASEVDEVFTFEVYEFEGSVFNQVGNGSITTIESPFDLSNDDKFLVYRNGVLMLNSSSIGSSVERYQQVSNTEILLENALDNDEYITIIRF